MAASNPSRATSRLSKATAISPEPCHICADLHRQIKYIAYGLDGLLADARDVPWSENIKSLIKEVLISHRDSKIASIIHLIVH